MSILINGIEMPISCRACRFAGFGGIRSEFNVCMFTGESQPKLISERMSRCPLVPVPKHGALIDRDDFFAICPELVNGYKTITDGCVVIPAEEGE